jgi:triphosphoribosyl-dephospho-CoA synthase
MNRLEDPVAAAYVAACLAELDAPKPGNVHRFASGHRMEVGDFVRSAEASAAPIALRGARVGTRVRAAIDATLESVGQNTNLGIVLLCAPLAAAAEAPDMALRSALVKVLGGLDRADAQDVFAAIAAANPGGLGHAPRYDVNAPAAVTLRVAMSEAADRDRIARQYVTTYEDIFSLGLPVLETAHLRYGEARWSTLAVYLTFLSEIVDTHIARKFEAATAEAVRRDAGDLRDAFATARDPEEIVDRLLGWDATLKSRGINPGTTADLTVATLFTSKLLAIRDDKCASSTLPLRANDD